MADAAAIFVPFPPRIVTYALANYQMQISDDCHYKDEIYNQLSNK